MRLLPFFMSLFLIFFALPKPAKAQELKLGIYPPIIEIEAEPGSVVSETLTVYGQAGDLFKMSAEYFSPVGDLGKVQNHGKNPYYNLPEYCINQAENEIVSDEIQQTPCDLLLYLNSPLQWLKYKDNQFILAKTSDNALETSRQIGFKLVIPGKTPPGDYYFTLFATNLGKAEGLVSGNTQHLAKVGTNILLTVKGDKEKFELQPEIVEFKAPWIVTKIPFEFQAKIENQGNVRFKTFRNLEIFNVAGKKVADSNLVPLNVLKKSTRLLQTSLQPGVLAVDPTQNKSVLGAATTRTSPNFYTAYLNIYPDNAGEAPLIAKTSFLYIPREFIMVVLILLGGFVYYRVNKRKRSPKNLNTYVKPRKF